MDRIRGLPIEDFLARLGYSPVWRKRNDLWYNAPYREERTPSFKVNTDRNVWFDFGLGRGGDIFTLAGEFAGSTDFLTQAKYISEAVGGNFVPLPTPRPAKERVSEPAFQEVEQRTLLYGVLKGYLSERGIPSEVAAAIVGRSVTAYTRNPISPSGFRTCREAGSCAADCSRGAYRRRIFPSCCGRECRRMPATCSRDSSIFSPPLRSD